jgi:hypothetical protein
MLRLLAGLGSRGAEMVAEIDVAEGFRSQRFGIDRTDAGLDDGQRVVSEFGESAGQLVCFGSDQAERPVMTSNFLRSELTS